MVGTQKGYRNCWEGVVLGRLRREVLLCNWFGVVWLSLFQYSMIRTVSEWASCQQQALKKPC